MRSPSAGLANLQHLLPVPPTNHASRILIAPAPTAHADHFVKIHPMRESVVRRVNDRDTSALPDVILEGGHRCRGPIVAIVVENNDVVFGEVRLEILHALPLARAGRDIHRESSGAFQSRLEQGSCNLPLVVVLAIDDQGLELVRGSGRLRIQKELRAQHQAGQPIVLQAVCFHNVCIEYARISQRIV